MRHNARQSDNNITIEFMFAGINMFWARLGLILALRRARNIFMPKNINSITITLEGIEEINTEKMTTKYSEGYIFRQRCEKMSTNFEMACRLAA